jgi:hypothetical protein
MQCKHQAGLNPNMQLFGLKILPWNIFWTHWPNFVRSPSALPRQGTVLLQCVALNMSHYHYTYWLWWCFGMDHKKNSKHAGLICCYISRWLVTMVLESMRIISGHRLVTVSFLPVCKMLGFAIHPREVSKHVIEICGVETCPFLSNNICLILKSWTKLISLLPSLASFLW